MAIIKIKPFEELDGLRHIATTWEIASDPDFLNMVEIQRSETMLNYYVSKITIPIGVTYYVRARRHFTEENADYYTESAKLTSTHHNVINMVSDTGVEVDTPILYVNEDDIKNINLGRFEIRTSKFRGKGDGHVYTHWIIKSADGRVIFKSLYNNKSLTAITITKTNELSALSQMIIHAIHVSSNGSESPVGKYVVHMSDYNYEISSVLTDVNPLEDYTIKLTVKNKSQPIKVSRMEVVNPNKMEVIKTIPLDINNNTFTIPKLLLDYGSTLYLDIWGWDSKNLFTSNRVKLSTKAGYLTPIEDISILYDNTLTDSKYILEDVNNEHINSSIELPSGYIPYTKPGSVDIYKWKIDKLNNRLIATDETLNGAAVILTTSDNNNFLYTPDSILIVDTMKLKDGKRFPVFLIFNHNRHKDTFDLIRTVSREDETHTTGITNAILQYDNKTFYYVAYGTRKFRKLDILTGVVTEVCELPEKFVNAKMVYTPKGSIMFIGNEAFTQVYSIEDNTFVAGPAITDGTFLEAKLKTRLLPNGDTIIYKTEPKDKDDNNPFFLRFDYKNKKFVYEDFSLAKYNYPKGDILLMDNRVMLGNMVTKEQNPKLRVDSFVVKEYK